MCAGYFLNTSPSKCLSISSRLSGSFALVNYDGINDFVAFNLCGHKNLSSGSSWIVNFTLLPSATVLIHSASGFLGSPGRGLKCGLRSAVGLCSRMRLMDGGIFRPVSSRKILSMGVSTLAVRPDIEHFGENHSTRRSCQAELKAWAKDSPPGCAARHTTGCFVSDSS